MIIKWHVMKQLQENSEYWPRHQGKALFEGFAFLCKVPSVVGDGIWFLGGVVQKCGKMPWHTCKIRPKPINHQLWPWDAMGTFLVSENTLDVRDPGTSMTPIIPMAGAPPHSESAKANDPRDLGSFENPVGILLQAMVRRIIPLHSWLIIACYSWLRGW